MFITSNSEGSGPDSDSLEKPRIKPATPGLQGQWFNHNTTAACNSITSFENSVDPDLLASDEAYTVFHPHNEYTCISIMQLHHRID